VLRATKYMDLTSSVLGLGARILFHLRDTKVLPLPELFERIVGEVGPSARYNFSHAASFLFLVGRLEYDERQDIVRLLEPEVN